MPLEILNCLGLLDHLKQFKSLHQPEYEMRHYNDHKHILTELEPVINEINEIEQLVIYLKKAANNEAIIVTLGDCAESILDSHECIVRNIDAYKNVQRCIEKITKKPVILLGRIAGQFFKPRSAEIEVFIIHFTGFFLQRINDKTMVKSYKGDAINSHEIDKRFHDIRRLKTANECAINKYNFIKKMKSNFDRLFIAHEALHLEYEAHLTRNFGDKLYNVSCHFPWIGDRTRQLFLFAFLKFFLIKEKEVMLLTLVSYPTPLVSK